MATLPGVTKTPEQHLNAFVSHLTSPLEYKTKALINSDHLMIETLLQIGQSEKRGFWKLNTKRLKNRDVIKDIKKKNRND